MASGSHCQRRGQTRGGKCKLHGCLGHGRGVVLLAQMGQNNLRGAGLSQRHGKPGGFLVSEVAFLPQKTLL